MRTVINRLQSLSSYYSGDQIIPRRQRNINSSISSINSIKMNMNMNMNMNAISVKKKRRILLISLVGIAIFMFQDTLNWSNSNTTGSSVNTRSNNNSNWWTKNRAARISRVYQPQNQRQLKTSTNSSPSSHYIFNGHDKNANNNNGGYIIDANDYTNDYDSNCHRLLRSGTDTCAKSPFINADQAMKQLQMAPTSTANTDSPPSHVVLCQELINRNDAAQRHRDAVDLSNSNTDPKVEVDPALLKAPVFTKFSVKESNQFCTDFKRPHSALMEVISSSIVAYVGRRFGLDYNPRCHDSLRTTSTSTTSTKTNPSTNDFDITTIQEILPHASMPINERHVQLSDIVHNSCHACIQEYTKKRNHYDTRQQTHHCLAFPELQNIHTSTVRMEEFDTSDPYAMPEVRFQEDVVDATNHVVRTGLGAVLPLVKDRLNHAAVDWAPKSRIPSHDPRTGAVIYIDADTSTAVPFWVLERILTKQVTSVSILSGPECAMDHMLLRGLVPGQNVQGQGMQDVTCLQYALELKQYLKNHYKDTAVVVTFNLVSSTAAAFTRMILAHTLICPPGTVSCFLPALAKTADRNTVILETPQQLRGTSQWFMELGSEAGNVKVIALTPEQLGVDQDQIVIQNQYAGLHVQEVMGGKGQGHVPVVAGAAATAATVAQGGAGNAVLAPRPQVPMKQPVVNVATEAVASADSKHNGNYELLENANVNEVKAEEVTVPAAIVEETPTPVETEDEQVINEFDFAGLFGAER